MLDLASREWIELVELAERHNLHDRTVSALYAAASGQLRRTTCQADEGLTRDQAIRDLQTLGRLNLIEPIGRGRCHHRYLGGDSVRAIASRLRAETDTAPLREPYPDA